MKPRASVSLPREAAVAGGIAVLLTCLLAWVCAPVVEAYFPYAEEWKLLVSSLPGLADPAQWLTGFGKFMRDPYTAWGAASVDFFRPVMNAIYWLRGAAFGENWGLYLYVNFACLGLVAGTLYLCLRTLKIAPESDRNSQMPGPWLAGALVCAFILMPPMVSSASRFLPLILPQFPFGRLVAALGLLACLSYVYRRYWLAALLLAAALLTKEQALPMAIALPLTWAWTNRRNLPAALPTLLLLLTPLLAWLAIRLGLYGSISQGVYVLQHETTVILRRFVVGLIRLPLYAPSLSGALREPLSWNALLVACNAIVLAYVALDISRRCWVRGLDVVSTAAIGYWGFLAIVGLNPRYGTILIALTILILARQPAPGIAPIMRTLALAALLAYSAVHGWFTLQSYPTHVAFSQSIYQVGRDYAAALSEVDENTEVVVVLNDPNTMFNAVSDLALTLGLPVTQVFKASDFPWRWPEPHARTVPDQPCVVSARFVSVTTVEMQQSCGLHILGARVPQELPALLPLTRGISAEFPDTQFAPAPFGVDMGQRLLLHIERQRVQVLYFDPVSRSFQWLDRPQASAKPLSDTSRP